MGDFRKYIEEYAVRAELDNEKVRNQYLNVMETSIAAYDFDDIKNKIGKPLYDFQDIFEGYSRIGMSRLLNVMSFLVKHGRMEGVISLWENLMTAMFEDLLKDHSKSGVEFIILELCTALLAMAGRTSLYNEYCSMLAKINPYEKYDSTLESKKPEDLHNFCMYGICSEYLRGLVTGIDTDDFINSHWRVQREKFNESGRYMDPGCPMVYDLTSRYRLALMLYLGYDGESSSDMKEVLKKGAFNLLFQMSSDFKFPYGGRSNQFNFNETLCASMFEYYAKIFAAEGDEKTAGLFRHSAFQAVRGLERWLSEHPARHIKNMFPADSNFGIDSYGTYERYMGTMGTFMSGALIFSDEDISGYMIPDDAGGRVLWDEDEFHKIFASAGGYSVEIDYDADEFFDASGLGRIHCFDAPAELALSMPFAAHPKYLLGEFSNNLGRCIGPYWKSEGKRKYLSELSSGCKLCDIESSPGRISFTVVYETQDGNVREMYKIDRGGVSIRCKCDFTDISYCVPVLASNGKDTAAVETGHGECSVRLGEWVYQIKWEPQLESTVSEQLLYNRNGVYRELDILNNSRELSVHFKIKRSAE